VVGRDTAKHNMEGNEESLFAVDSCNDALDAA
jgi:hypothetical protein